MGQQERAGLVELHKAVRLHPVYGRLSTGDTDGISRVFKELA